MNVEEISVRGISGEINDVDPSAGISCNLWLNASARYADCLNDRHRKWTGLRRYTNCEKQQQGRTCTCRKRDFDSFLHVFIISVPPALMLNRELQMWAAADLEDLQAHPN